MLRDLFIEHGYPRTRLGDSLIERCKLLGQATALQRLRPVAADIELTLPDRLQSFSQTGLSVTTGR